MGPKEVYVVFMEYSIKTSEFAVGVCLGAVSGEQQVTRKQKAQWDITPRLPTLLWNVTLLPDRSESLGLCAYLFPFPFIGILIVFTNQNNLRDT